MATYIPSTNSVLGVLAAPEFVAKFLAPDYGSNPPSEAVLECMQADVPDMEALRSMLLRKRPNVNLKERSFGWTPILFAANAGQAEAMGLLVEARADLKAHCNSWNSPLHIASRAGHDAIVRYVLAKGTDKDVKKAVPVDAKNMSGWTPLNWAAVKGHSDVVYTLLEAQAHGGSIDRDGRNVAMYAAEHGHLAVLKHLLNQGVDLDHRDHVGKCVADYAQEHAELQAALVIAQRTNSSLLDAVQRNSLEEVKAAIQDGAHVNVRDESGWKPLSWAMLHKSVELVQLLAQHAADLAGACDTDIMIEALGTEAEAMQQALHAVEASKKRMLTAARAAIWPQVCDELKAGISPNAREEETLLTCLMCAAIHEDLRMVKMLAVAKAEVDLSDRYGWTAMHYSVQTGNLELVSLLHSLSANLRTKKTYEGYTPLHCAVRADDAAMVSVLFAGMANVDVKSTAGELPLQIAARWGSVAALGALLKAMANVNVQDSSHSSILVLAVQRRQDGIVEELLEHPGHPSALEHVHLTEEQQKDSAFGLLVSAKQLRMKKKDADSLKQGQGHLVNVADGSGKAPLAWAAELEDPTIMKLLLSHKAEVNAEDKEGNTALTWAVVAGSVRTVECLLIAGADWRQPNQEEKTPMDLASGECLSALQLAAIEDLNRARTPPGKKKAAQKQEQEMQLQPRTVYRLRIEGLSVLVEVETLRQRAAELIQHLISSAKISGPLSSEIVADPITGVAKGYAYFDFPDKKDVQKAIKFVAG
eukprot:CAMPEP_0178384608 /NCGR_PEP_ID=MMETSP0689_2-20121128/7602_1 /TAXON_ID=160604 /ORGANISM="Amphidinium massartii, Strain CS-259" /LENGTH=758 /DNA_ID=CAMNT_0020004859 /DNA_START=116 /DNA_END=2388 /DNA_ORIENTATION=+